MTVGEVESWMARYDNPMRDVVARLRQIMLQSDDRITEVIKWQTPTFVYKGYLASFYPKSLNHATLMFHSGASIPGHFPHLETAGPEARAMRIVSIAEAEERRDEIAAIVSSWIDYRDAAEARQSARG